MDRQRWDAVNEVLLRHRIRPIVAIVPANADPSLIRAQADPAFWQQARSWEKEGWMLALHGYSHLLRRSPAGLVPVNRRSEFIGLSEDEQRQRIRDGIRLLALQGIAPQAWVAPAHGSDRFTLEALKAESQIRMISDGFSRRAVRRGGFVWIPQQLWHPRQMGSGLWTICLHPNEMDKDAIHHLESFINGRQGSFPDPRVAASRAVPYGLPDMTFEIAFLALLRIKRGLDRGNS